MVYGWGSEQFPKYYAFYEMKAMGHVPGEHPRVPRSMFLNAPYHKERVHIWFMCGDLNGFKNIRHFMK